MIFLKYSIYIFWVLLVDLLLGWFILWGGHFNFENSKVADSIRIHLAFFALLENPSRYGMGILQEVFGWAEVILGWLLLPTILAIIVTHAEALRELERELEECKEKMKKEWETQKRKAA